MFSHDPAEASGSLTQQTRIQGWNSTASRLQGSSKILGYLLFVSSQETSHLPQKAGQEDKIK